MKLQNSIELVDNVQKISAEHGLFTTNDKLLVGISGGSDSVALLHILSQIVNPKNLFAVYINHGLREKEIKEEIFYLSKFCEDLNVCFSVSEVPVIDFAKQKHLSLEESGRILRYERFQQLAKEYHCRRIAVAHTADDQVENFFIRLFRGSGSKGLTGMDFINGNIIRPLLSLHKRDLQEYLSEKGIRWCEDSSNNDSRFLRNRIRNELLPLLEERFSPPIRNQILQVMDILQTEDIFLSDLTKTAFKNCINEERNPVKLSLVIDPFRKEPLAIKRRIIEQCCWKMNAQPDFNLIDRIIKFASSHTGKELHLEKGLRIIRKDNEIEFSYPLPEGQIRGSFRQEKHISSFVPVILDRPGKYKFSTLNYDVIIDLRVIEKNQIHNIKKSSVLVVDSEKITFPLTLRAMTAGDRFVPCNTIHTKKIARFFSEHNIPSDLRRDWPILLDQQGIIGILGVAIHDRCKVTDNTKTILCIMSTMKEIK